MKKRKKQLKKFERQCNSKPNVMRPSKSLMGQFKPSFEYFTGHQMIDGNEIDTNQFF